MTTYLHDGKLHFKTRGHKVRKHNVDRREKSVLLPNGGSSTFKSFERFVFIRPPTSCWENCVGRVSFWLK